MLVIKIQKNRKFKKKEKKIEKKLADNLQVN